MFLPVAGQWRRRQKTHLQRRAAGHRPDGPVLGRVWDHEQDHGLGVPLHGPTPRGSGQDPGGAGRGRGRARGPSQLLPQDQPPLHGGRPAGDLEAGARRPNCSHQILRKGHPSGGLCHQERCVLAQYPDLEAVSVFFLLLFMNVLSPTVYKRSESVQDWCMQPLDNAGHFTEHFLGLVAMF